LDLKWNPPGTEGSALGDARRRRLADAEFQVRRPNRPPPTSPSRKKKTSTYFSCGDADEAGRAPSCQRLRIKESVTIYGARQLFVTDPDGFSCFQHAVQQATASIKPTEVLSDKQVEFRSPDYPVAAILIVIPNSLTRQPSQRSKMPARRFPGGQILRS
jgi:hypothetical protein